MSDTDVPNKNSSPPIEAIEFDVPPSPQQLAARAQSAASAGSQTAFDPSAGAALKPQAPWWHSQFNLMLGVFGLLAISAVALIFLTPDPSTGIPATITQSEQAGAAAKVEAPWDDSRRAQARTDSQEILSNLLSSKKSLEAKQVKDWGAEVFRSALESARQGDEFYKEKDYQQAINTYQAAVDQLDSLHGRIPDLVKGRIQQGNQALREGKSQLAERAFKFALHLDADSVSAADGLDRAKKLDEVLALLQSASAAEQLFIEQDKLSHLTDAQEKLSLALTIDPLFKQTVELQQRIDQRAIDKQFRVAMSQGYNALFKEKYSSARNAFSTALKIKPDNATAKAAYQQSLASNKSSSLSSLIKSAARFEANEDWQNALSTYRAVLQRDPNQVAAKLGEIRSGARGQLDTQLRQVLADTLELGKGHRRDSANTVLADARAISSRGPKLAKQIADIENALQTSDKVVRVQIVSDALTDITLVKAGAQKISLGKFSSKNLALKPGRYVVSGVRIGFRDVRKEIELYPGANQVQSFNVRCDEPVGLNQQDQNNDKV